LVQGAHQRSAEGTVLQSREPIFNVPGVVLGVLAVCAAVHIALQLMPDETRLFYLIALAFVPARYAGIAGDLPGGELAVYTSPFTHMVTHADIVHLLINAAWLLAFGSILSRRIGALRFLAFSIAGGLAGALMFYVMHPHLAAPVIGASGAIAAMMGGVMRFLFNAVDRREGHLLRSAPQLIPSTTLAQALSNKRILVVSLLFIGLNLGAIFGFGLFGASGSIAWEAHLGGYLFGLLAFGLFDSAPQNPSPSALEQE